MKSVFTFLLLLVASAGMAQTTDEAAIENVIARVFTGMAKNDSSMVRQAFTKEVSMATVALNKSMQPELTREHSLDGFLKAVASPKKAVLNEEIWNLKIHVDGEFAAAWCDYALYYGKSFIHCGVDAFHLFKTSEGWKIFHLADTRRKENCDVPEHIKDKYK
jgi:hypothetical protein